METYSVEILNPKAIRLPEYPADLELITIKPRPAVGQPPVLTEAERAEAQERIRRGSPYAKRRRNAGMVERVKEGP